MLETISRWPYNCKNLDMKNPYQPDERNIPSSDNAAYIFNYRSVIQFQYTFFYVYIYMTTEM